MEHLFSLEHFKVPLEKLSNGTKKFQMQMIRTLLFFFSGGEGQGGPYRGGPPGRDGYVNGNNRWRDEEGPYRGGRGGRTATAFGRQRSRHDGHDLPEWAMDDDDDRMAGGAGGTFDSSGKFRAPSSESPPPASSSKAGSAPPPDSKESNGKPDRSGVRNLGKGNTCDTLNRSQSKFKRIVFLTF